MEELLIHPRLAADQIRECLKAAMPGLTVFEWHLVAGDDAPVALELENNAHICFDIDETGQLGFSQRLTVYRTPDEDAEARALWLGQKISAQYNVEVLVSFSHPEDPHNPFYDIVFQQGIRYLADDIDAFGVEDPKPVRILGRYDVPQAEFDIFGKLPKPS